MTIHDDIASERAKLAKVVMNNKLGKLITSDILYPVLDTLDKQIPNILYEAGVKFEKILKSYLSSIAPSGFNYKVYMYDASKPRGERTWLIDEWTASSPGDPPAQHTGTLFRETGFMVLPNGKLRVGLLKDEGEMSDDETEFKSAFFRGGKVFVSADDSYNIQTPVGTYGREHGDWFIAFMDIHREQLRKLIRNSTRKALNKITRKTSLKRAVIFKVYFK
jgi:hypothetical protein